MTYYSEVPNRRGTLLELIEELVMFLSVHICMEINYHNGTNGEMGVDTDVGIVTDLDSDLNLALRLDMGDESDLGERMNLC